MIPPDQREEWIIREARERLTAERAAFLDGACAGDVALRERLLSLLAGHDQTNQATEPDAAHPTIRLIRPDVPDEAVGQTLGRYKLMERVGEGGCGVVYVAEQIAPVRRRVALKVIKLGMDTKQVVARFEAERQALAMMDHPNIAKVFDAGTTHAGRPFFVMELVRGIRITDYCDQANLTTKERLDLFIKVCQAIQHAHQKGIIHRDIKPSNILVTLHDGVPVPKVIDFGIAKATEGRLTDATVYTQLHQFIGTPAYMSPEQAEMSGLDIDTRSDIYSLGVLLYELLAGSTPFDAEELMAAGIDAMRKTIREREPPRPSTRLATLGADELTTTAKRRSADTSKLLHQLRGDLDWIVMKCLEKDRTRRYETANGLAVDLKRHLNSEPVLARPPSAAYRFQKAFRRNKLVFGAGAAVVLALLTGLSLAAIGWRQTRRERDNALQARAGEEAQRKAAQASEQKARTAEAGQIRLREEAEAQTLAARRTAYASDMNLVQQALAANNLGRARDVLYRQLPQAGQKDLRGWEWRYLWQDCQSDVHFNLCQQPSSIWSLAASSDGQWLAIGDMAKGGLSVWNPRTKSQIALLSTNGSNLRVAFSPSGPLLAFSDYDHVRLWDGATRQTLGQDLPLGGQCLGLAFSADDHTLVTYAAGPANQLALWRVPEGTKLVGYPVPQFNNLGGTPGTPFAAAADLSVAAVAPDDTIHLIDLASGKDRWSARATDETVKALALSPDGSMLASGAGFVDAEIRLWDVASGREIRRLEGHRAWVGGLVFWPDGKKLASASGDQTIRLWDLTDPGNVPAPRVLRGHNLEVWRLALLPDARTLVSECKDGWVYLWDTTTAQPGLALSTLPEPVDTWRFAPDSLSVLALDPQGGVVRWKGTGFQEKESLLIADPGYNGACISADGKSLALGTTNGEIRIWDLQARSLSRQSKVSTGPVLPVGFSGDGNNLVIASPSNGSSNGISFQERNLTTGKDTASWHSPINMDRSEFVFNSLSWRIKFMSALSPDGRWSVSSDGEGAGLLRTMATGEERKVNFGLRLAGLNYEAFSPDGNLFAVVSPLGYGRVLETSTFKEVMRLHGFLMGLHSSAFSPDAARLAVGGDGKEAIKLWDLESHLDLLTLEGRGSRFTWTAFSPDGNVLGSVNDKNVLHLWRAPSWEQIAAAERKEKAEMR